MKKPTIIWLVISVLLIRIFITYRPMPEPRHNYWKPKRTVGTSKPSTPHLGAHVKGMHGACLIHPLQSTPGAREVVTSLTPLTRKTEAPPRALAVRRRRPAVFCRRFDSSSPLFHTWTTRPQGRCRREPRLMFCSSFFPPGFLGCVIYLDLLHSWSKNKPSCCLPTVTDMSMDSCL